MSNKSISQASMITAASAGVDVISNTATHTPQPGSRGWAFLVVSVEAVIDTIVDNGSPVSTNLTGVTFSAGTLLSSNGIFTSVKLTSGTVVMIRG